MPTNWRNFTSRLILITIGTVIGAVSVIVFFAPFNIAPAGISGIAVIMNERLNMPIGLVVLIGNIPIVYMAYRMLGGWKSVIWISYVTVLFSIVIETLSRFFPAEGVSSDLLLNALFAGAVGGIGSGFVYRGGATFGGTSAIARILQEKMGIPLSSTYLYANLAVIVLAGIFLGWESALLSLVALTMEGIVSDYIMEGPSVIRTIIIITNRPQEVSEVILYQVGRGVTGWDAKGMYTGQERHMLFVTVPRPQVEQLKTLVTAVDPEVFLVVGQGHVAYGSGFRQLKPKSRS